MSLLYKCDVSVRVDENDGKADEMVNRSECPYFAFLIIIQEYLKELDFYVFIFANDSIRLISFYLYLKKTRFDLHFFKVK